MYRSIVFDLGGVVLNYNPKDYLADLFFHEPTENKIYESLFGSAEWQLLDQGLITWDKASDIFLKRARDKGVEFEMQAVLDNWLEMLETKKPTVKLMRLMKKMGFDLYYLSNMSEDVFELIRKRKFFELFEGGIASYQVGVNKPSPEIYQALLNQYKLVPEETIFTDDNRENTLAAFQAGMTGIQWFDVKNFCKKLVTYGIEV